MTANVAPRLLSEMCRFAIAGNGDEARAINERLMPVHKQMFVQSNPIPVKWALKEMGRIQELRYRP